MTRRLSLSLAMLITGMALLVASAVAGLASETRKGGTLRMSTPSDVDYVDPALAYFGHEWQIGYATCAKLFNYPDAAGAAGTRPVPEVVDRYTVSQDRRTYTFDLKRSFRFHRGARVTAQRFADAFDRVAQPKLDSPAKQYMHEIAGADAVINGKAESISGVRVLGRYRLRIRLTRPLGDFTARLTLPFFCPILPNTPVDPAGIDDPPGSGPYYVAERIRNQRILLKRNPFYRGQRPANVDQVVWTSGTSREACLLALEGDRVDYCNEAGLPFTAYRSLVEKYGVNRTGGRFLVSPSLATWYLAFNHNRPAFKGTGQIPLKKAINFAIDRPELARAFGYLAGQRTDQMLPPALGGPAKLYPLGGADPTTARAWLERATYRPKELVLYARSDAIGVAIADVLDFNLKQIGIDVAVKYFDPIELARRVTTRGEPFDVTIAGWAPDYPDAAGFLVPLLRRNSDYNLIDLDDPRVERRMDAADRLTGEQRRTAWADIDVDLMRDNPPWAPFAHTMKRALISRSTDCFVDHPVYGFDIAAVCKR